MAKSRDNKDKSTNDEDDKAAEAPLTPSETGHDDTDPKSDDSLTSPVSDDADASTDDAVPENASSEPVGEGDEVAPADVEAAAAGAEATDADTDTGDTPETAETDATQEGPSDDGPAAGTSAIAASRLISDGQVAEEKPDAKPADTSDDTDSGGHGGDHDDEEEHGRSFAARALTWLILLIAGGGIALWGAPKVAPHLPEGLGPVKAWMMPGTLDTEERINALEGALVARIDSIEPGVDEATVSAAVADAVAAAEARLTEQMTALSDKVEAADSASIEGRIAQLETRLEGLTRQVEGLSGLSADAAATSGEELSAFAATVEGLRGELAALAGQQGGLSQRIDDVEVAVQRRLTEAEEEIAAVTAEAEQTKSAALANAALTSIEAAISAGVPFEEALAQLAANTDQDVPEALSAVAGSGVSTLGALRSGFVDAAHAAIKADVQERDAESVGGRLAAFIESQVATRSLTPQEGDSTDAVLSRAEEALRQDNPAAALDELSGLSMSASVAMGDWLSRARARVDAVSALNDLRGTIDASN